MRRLLAPAILLTAACGNMGSPEILSSDVYEFREVALSHLLIFHWPRSALPVRFWVAENSPIRQNVVTGIARWQGAFLYGEFRATIVSDSNVADVIVRNTPSDIGGALNARARECIGETDIEPDPNTGSVPLPMHVFMYALVPETNPALPACYDVTMTHEIGHILGIINVAHAGTTSADVMFGNPSFAGISERDRQTAVTLYHTTPTITITGRR
jgi:predicted Zn-dependent protease